MKNHEIKVYPSKNELKREDQLAWKIAAVASDPVGVDDDVKDMIINRIIDNASVAIACKQAFGSKCEGNGYLSPKEWRRDYFWHVC